MSSNPDNPNDSSGIRNAQQKATIEGLPPLIVVDGPLPGGAVAIERFATGGGIDSYIAISSDNLTSGLLNKVIANVFGRLTFVHLGTLSRVPTTVTWFSDGRFVTEAIGAQKREARVEPFSEIPGDATTDQVRSLLVSAPRVSLPGIGSGRIVQFNRPGWK